MSIEAAFFGRLGRDGELKRSRGGNPYLRLNVRVGNGDAAQWLSVMAFDREAITAADKFVQHARVYIEGSLTLNEWTTDAGEKRAGLSVLSFHTRLAAIGKAKPKRERAERSQRSTAAGGTPVANDGGFHSDPLPFAPEWR